MALDKPYEDIPGTTVFDSDMARAGYHVNQFCMTLMNKENRHRFRADERAYVDEWPMTEEQKQAVLDRDYNKLLKLGANVYYFSKLFFTDRNRSRSPAFVGNFIFLRAANGEGRRILKTECCRVIVVNEENDVGSALLHAG